MSDIPTVSGPDYPMGEGFSSLPVIKGYKILKQLGEGGMGIVYLAEQTEPIKRQVALKVVKPGMDSKQVIARFEAERQALAHMDHPNIAHVYDAGTTEKGRPYFVMEYINGTPITDYCDQQELSIEERLELFKQVCDGIQHAHQRGIIHRDIKPSNILIVAEDGKATPKVIDFGIAKAIKQELTEQTMFTAQGQLIGTPEYMSPEQADLNSFKIDIRTDVYSLGVILYQLLTGTLPFDPQTLRSAAYNEIQRIIREVEPPRPSTKLSSLGAEAQEFARARRTVLSTLTKKLHKELEWIPLKAMRKESEHRYQSVSELAHDIENYLKGAPLVAGPESNTYRLKKYIRRERISLSVVLFVEIFAISMIVGFTLFTRHEQKGFFLTTISVADRDNLIQEYKSSFIRKNPHLKKAALAIINNNFETAKNVIESDFTVIKDEDCFGRSLMYYAIMSDDKDIAKMLIDAGISLKCNDKDGNTPLHWAMSKFPINKELLTLLISNGLTFDQMNNEGLAPLHYMCLRSHNIITSADKKSIKHVIEDYNLNVNLKDRQGRTPIHLICHCTRSFRLVEIIIENGADVQARDSQGRTPLMLCALNECLAINAYAGNSLEEKFVNILIDNGADINAKDNEGNTALHYAVLMEKEVISNILIQHGAN